MYMHIYLYSGIYIYYMYNCREIGTTGYIVKVYYRVYALYIHAYFIIYKLL